MLKAEIGDYLYFIIFAIVMIIGAIDKAKKAKRQQQANVPRTPQSYDDFEDVDGEQRQTPPPKTMEELMKRMLQTMEKQEPETVYSKPEPSFDISQRNTYYQPIVTDNIQPFTPVAAEEETVNDINHKFEFDIRQAIIANEILNRKY